MENFDIVNIESKGRGLIAKREIKAGECILEEETYGFVVNRLFQDYVCSYCGTLVQDGRIFAISDQDLARYCSESCIRADYQLHMFEVGAQALVRSIGGSDTCHLVMKLAATRKYENATGAIRKKNIILKDRPTLGRENIFSEVMTLDAVKDFVSMDSQESIAETARSLASLAIQSKLPLSSKEAEHLIYAIHCNGHQLLDQHENFIGVGIFPLTSMINHSCVPNAAHSFVFEAGKPPRLMMKALVNIESGAEILYSYVRLYQATSARREHLKNVYSFLCHCSRCDQGGFMVGDTVELDNVVGCPDVDKIEESIISEQSMFNEKCSELSEGLSKIMDISRRLVANDVSAFQELKVFYQSIDANGSIFDHITISHVIIFQSFIASLRFVEHAIDVVAKDLESSSFESTLLQKFGLSSLDLRWTMGVALIGLGSILHYTRCRQLEVGKIERSVLLILRTIINEMPDITASEVNVMDLKSFQECIAHFFLLDMWSCDGSRLVLEYLESLCGDPNIGCQLLQLKSTTNVVRLIDSLKILDSCLDKISSNTFELFGSQQ